MADFNGDRQPDPRHHQVTGELYFWYMDGLTRTFAGYMSPSRVSDVRWGIVPR